MSSKQFQALNRTLKSGKISEFITIINQFTENRPSCFSDLINSDLFSKELIIVLSPNACLLGDLMSLTSYLIILTS